MIAMTITTAKTGKKDNLLVLKDWLALLGERRHTLFLVMRREECLEQTALETDALRKREFVGW